MKDCRYCKSGSRCGFPIQRIIVALFCFFALCAPACAFSQEITGRVVAITDGDTLKILTPAHEQIKIRLADIDAPEHDQPYGSRAKQALSDLAYGKTLSIEDEGLDRYGRTIGLIHAGQENVNADLVSEGAAWVYRRYSHDPALLANEAQAKAAKRGLWALPEAQRIPPWEWRKEQKTRRESQ
jgi:endonuclease YncB( thermonuclease family)